ncbi:MAG: AAA family ATPase [Bacteroidales bacterium]|nr:AAA family ATPase [Bacteroidales bacterium]
MDVYVKADNGRYSCDIGVTTEEWIKILSNPDVTTTNYKDALMAFYNEPDHKSTCKTLSLKHYGNAKDAQKFNSWITGFGKAVVKHLNRFQIIDADGAERFWHVSMCYGRNTEDGLFETTLRPEIVSAIESLGWNRRLTWIPYYIEMADKLSQYKDNRKPLLDIVYALDKKSVGYIKAEDGGHVSDIDPFTVYGIFNRGITNDNRIKLCHYFKEKLHIQAPVPSDFDGIPVVNNMMATFYRRENESTDIQPLWDLFLAVLTNDKEKVKSSFDVVANQQGIKWNITMGLYWIRPYDYISLDSRNRDYLPSLDINVFKENQIDAEHYIPLLENVKEKIETSSIKEKDIPEISYQAWVTDSGQSSESSESKKNYWLLGHAYGSTEPQFDRFVHDGIWEGRFDESKPVDQRQLSLVRKIKVGDVIMLKSTAVKQRTIPFLRIKAVGIVTDQIEEFDGSEYKTCRCNVKYLSIEDKDFDGSSYGAYRQTVHVADEKAKEVITYADSIINHKNMPPKKYSKYIELLEEIHNLVLTGAPGTGKTFMAQCIAEEMGAEMKFVQFHPSYDYTDFVEGLRPVDNGNGQMGFERKDGVFKEFCKAAIKNIADSEKSVENLTKELSWQDKLEQFVEDAMENETKFKTVNGSEFSIADMKGHTIVVHNDQNEKTTDVTVNADEILDLLTQEIELKIVRDIRNHYGRKFGTQPDSYAFVIVKEIRAMKTKLSVATADKVEKKPFVFIIDEINRGEASKIFGELFYAIDPGYRGKTNVLVQTQYQNLVPESDVFAKGFYVPENVYILATMNDIDRSVESMDFAMRRRFTWQEITPADTQNMLDSLSCAAEAKDTMNRLNQVIADTDGLGAAYMIGPSYFLKLKDNGGNFDKLWTMNIEPLLKEYLRGFRKAADTLERFKAAYYKREEVKEDTSDLFDEEN